VVGHYGFMEDPDVPQLMKLCASQGLEFQEERTTFFLSRETLIATRSPGMAIWREKLFSVMARNAQRPTAFFRLPANRVVELGMQVEL
jgi:KUP system potassium uptake protein